MKKHLFLGILGAMALASCSSDDPISDNGGGNGSGTTNGEIQYLSVNIVSTPATPALASSKAAGNQTPGNPDDNATYEEGYASENAVKKVRFYFFDALGKAANVRGTETGVNFYDWENPETDGNDMPNIEKQLAATIVIHTGSPDGHSLPAQLVAVLNPTSALGEGAMDLDALRKMEEDYVASAKNSTEDAGAFVMMNSVYANNTNAVVANQIPESAYQATEELAKNNPVNIYVERNVAKVRVKFDHSTTSEIEYIRIGGEETGYSAALLKDKDGKNLTVEINGKQEQLYVRMFGWNVTGETDKGYLGKHIDPATWGSGNALFGTELWNFSPYFRSYWAQNPADIAQAWHTYDAIMTGGKNFSGDQDNSIYINENAPYLAASSESAAANVEKFTKVILKGQLITSTGTPVVLCKYAGMTMAGENTLKEALLDQLSQNGMIYKHTVVDGKNTVSSLTENDVVFKTALASGDTSVDESEKTVGRYYVYMQLAPEVKVDADNVWNFSGDVNNATGSDALSSVAKINAYLMKQLGSAQIYASGNTYYFFPLQHLGDEGKIGYYGVVRNHIYDCVIGSIAGLGTPVYDPTEVVYPEKPKEEDTFIGAKINILSWRVVPNNVKLEW